MRDDLFRNVAMPPTFLWAPQIAAIANMSLQMTVMFIVFALFQINFLVFVASIAICHFIIASYGFQEPHIDNMFKSLGKSPKFSKNMYSTKGVKLGS